MTHKSDTQRWQEQVLEELRAIRKMLEQGDARQVEYFSNGTIKRVSIGLCGFNPPTEGGGADAAPLSKGSLSTKSLF